MSRHEQAIEFAANRLAAVNGYDQGITADYRFDVEIAVRAYLEAMSRDGRTILPSIPSAARRLLAEFKEERDE